MEDYSDRQWTSPVPEIYPESRWSTAEHMARSTHPAGRKLLAGTQKRSLSWHQCHRWHPSRLLVPCLGSCLVSPGVSAWPTAVQAPSLRHPQTPDCLQQQCFKHAHDYAGFKHIIGVQESRGLILKVDSTEAKGQPST